MYIAPFSHAAAAADYKVTHLLPPEDDDYLYRIERARLNHMTGSPRKASSSESSI